MVIIAHYFLSGFSITTKMSTVAWYHALPAPLLFHHHNTGVGMFSIAGEGPRGQTLVHVLTGLLGGIGATCHFKGDRIR